MNEGAAADQAHARLQAILKAVVVGRDVADAASREAGESETLFQSAGAMVPPYDPEALCLLVEHSNALRQNLDAYAVNIDGFRHRLEPAIDFEAEDADARVADAIFLERDGSRRLSESPLAPQPLTAPIIVNTMVLKTAGWLGTLLSELHDGLGKDLEHGAEGIGGFGLRDLRTRDNGIRVPLNFIHRVAPPLHGWTVTHREPHRQGRSPSTPGSSEFQARGLTRASSRPHPSASVPRPRAPGR